MFPGVKVNVSKTGTSLSVGGRGATTNLGKRGVRTTVGIPGSGISYVTQRSFGRSSRSRQPAVPPQPSNRKWVVWVVLAGAGWALLAWL
ncbi:MAG TPA: DUF4236 domain-containing protein [Acetobacteraceae bacterium]|nr:DUF4236 domain-containing protein [Acetobacteraceae bacterium]